MNAMQRFKERTGKPFPTHGEVIKVAVSLGYRKPLEDDPDPGTGRTAADRVPDPLKWPDHRLTSRPAEACPRRFRQDAEQRGGRLARRPPPATSSQSPVSSAERLIFRLRDRHQCRAGEDVHPGVDGIPRQLHGAVELASGAGADVATSVFAVERQSAGDLSPSLRGSARRRCRPSTRGPTSRGSNRGVARPGR